MHSLSGFKFSQEQYAGRAKPPSGKNDILVVLLMWLTGTSTFRKNSILVRKNEVLCPEKRHPCRFTNMVDGDVNLPKEQHPRQEKRSPVSGKTTSPSFYKCG